MRAVRIIPRLDIKGPNLVKGIRLEGLRVLGRPEDFAYRYYLDGADELIYMDIVASLYGRNNLLDIVRRAAEKIFIPLTVGGGVRSIKDIRSLLRAGADKVAINTAAIQNPNLIKEGATIFGSQCIVLSIEAKKNNDGSYEAFTDNGRQETGMDAVKWAYMGYRLGAGEILLTSINRDGTGQGYDIELVSKIANTVPIPVVAFGGAGNLKDIEELIQRTQVSAISAASIFHYNQINKDSALTEFEEGNIEFLKKYSQANEYKFKRIQPLSISRLKTKLAKRGVIYMRPQRSRELLDEDNHAAEDKNAGSGPLVVVIDFGCGNLFSVAHALRKIGAHVTVSDDPKVVMQADRLVLPGVGSLGAGMSGLRRKGLIKPIKEQARKGTPLLGICLGMQLLMSEGEEFGLHKGLDVIKGKVARIEVSSGMSSICKIPHIGWNRIRAHRAYGKEDCRKNKRKSWAGTILEDVPTEGFMYFVHSNIVKPDDPAKIIGETEYGGNVFCSVIHDKNIYGCQFHPERSGETGLSIYKQFVSGNHQC